ncbi:Very-short-patch-repair endonuclease [Agrococcus jejuensis]|uniref:Very-short-patch-repair endonuclease n=2 Tax=Agrococcus jejuensis TaxID=399736 RepID=A0A1G8B998_9MICO|nr:Very-short-patch-repair endonuclease [Agrococcus jejuensis]
MVQRMGVVSAAQLEAEGWRRNDRRRALAAGQLTLVRAGWYARQDADVDVVAAVRAHGCLSCASALARHGAWIPERLRGVHVRMTRVADRRAAGCAPYGPVPSIRSAIDDVETAFRCLLRCAEDEDLVVVADSLLHLRLTTQHELEGWSTSAPRRLRRALARIDRAESGLETIVRVRLRAKGVSVRTQVQIGRHRVDLLVGDRLIVECDGGEHHAGWAAQTADRARDRELSLAGYVVVRLTYGQIVHDWEAVEADLMAFVRADRHRRRGTT